MKYLKVLFVFLVVFILAWMARWITMSETNDKTTIIIDKAEIKKDVDQVIDRGEKLFDKATSGKMDLEKNE